MRNATLFAAERRSYKKDYNTVSLCFAREIFVFGKEIRFFCASHGLHGRLYEPQRVFGGASAAQHGFNCFAHQPAQRHPLLRRVDFGQPDRVVLPDAAVAKRHLRLVRPHAKKQSPA